MAGLKLIEGYSSGSEDDEESFNESVRKKIKIDSAPLPKFIPIGVGVDHHEKVVDNPEEHNGRVRSFKHERGNWATLVYAAYEPSEDILSFMTSLSTKIPSANLILNDCHISFTRTLSLKYHWIDSFVEGIKDLIRKSEKFIFQITNLKIYCNDERTRTFLGLECSCLDQTLDSFMDSMNALLSDYQLPSFYKDASYHVSFLWLLGDREAELKKLIPSLNESLSEILSKNLENGYINVETIHCKLGNKLFKWPLR